MNRFQKYLSFLLIALLLSKLLIIALWTLDSGKRDRLLSAANVVVTPGEGFGRAGAGYVRISSFNTRENTEKAIERFRRTM